MTCPRGLAEILADEIRTLGLPVEGIGESAVETRGGLPEARRLNLWLRTGHRVLLRLGGFPARSPDDLLRGASALPWEDWFDPYGRFTVRGEALTTAVTDSRYALLKLKDAIADRMRERCGRRPDSGSDPRDAAAAFLWWQGERCVIYIDTTGVPLSHRGYRREGLAAPMRESLAAGVVLASGWRGGRPFLNPMCGSGTIAIEAAGIASGRAAGLGRREFAFMRLRGFDAGPWEAERAAAERTARALPPGAIVATDLRPEFVAAARRNATAAGAGAAIRFEACDFADTPRPEGAAVAVLNPEYGERLGEDAELEPVYRRIGAWFRTLPAGSRGCLITGNLRLAKRIGLKAARIRTMFNGPIECRFLEFDIFRPGAEGLTPDAG